MTTKASRARLAPLLALALLAACSREQPPAEPGSAGTAEAAPDVGATPAAPSGPIDVRPLAGQAEAGVAALLGAPQACADVAQGRRCTYARGVEIVYINGMADHMVVADLGGAPFEAATIARIGLAGAEPQQADADAIRWQNAGGMREIVLERGADGRAGRFVIKAMTP
jgi:hypothetical protein